MITATSGDFLGNRTWFSTVVGGKDLVLRRTSALECLELFVGYLNESQIDVYAKESGEYENINYHIVDSFDNLDIVDVWDIKCTSINQTINDMLSDFDNIDEQSLVEGLATYYYLHGDSFDGLEIDSQNQAVFDSIKEWAIEYHSEG